MLNTGAWGSKLYETRCTELEVLNTEEWGSKLYSSYFLSLLIHGQILTDNGYTLHIGNRENMGDYTICFSNTWYQLLWFPHITLQNQDFLLPPPPRNGVELTFALCIKKIALHGVNKFKLKKLKNLL